MEKRNVAFIASSLDGYIADKDGGLDWLQSVPNPDNLDLGYNKFIEGIDAIIMGRKTFETVCGFDCEWPYFKPVYVLSSTLEKIPDEYSEKAALVKGNLSEIVDNLNAKGKNGIYIDGGSTIQSFLKEDLIDEIIITTIPILLGGGSPLFGELHKEMRFEHVKSEIFLDTLVQDHYKRLR